MVEILAHVTHIAKGTKDLFKKPLINPEELIKLRMHLDSLKRGNGRISERNPSGRSVCEVPHSQTKLASIIRSCTYGVAQSRSTNSFHVGNLFAEISGSVEDVETPWIGSNAYLEALLAAGYSVVRASAQRSSMERYGSTFGRRSLHVRNSDRRQLGNSEGICRRLAHRIALRLSDQLCFITLSY